MNHNKENEEGSSHMSTAEEFVDSLEASDRILAKIMWTLCGVCVASLLVSALIFYIHF